MIAYRRVTIEVAGYLHTLVLRLIQCHRGCRLGGWRCASLCGFGGVLHGIGGRIGDRGLREWDRHRGSRRLRRCSV